MKMLTGFLEPDAGPRTSRHRRAGAPKLAKPSSATCRKGRLYGDMPRAPLTFIAEIRAGATRPSDASARGRGRWLPCWSRDETLSKGSSAWPSPGHPATRKALMATHRQPRPSQKHQVRKLIADMAQRGHHRLHPHPGGGGGRAPRRSSSIATASSRRPKGSSPPPITKRTGCPTSRAEAAPRRCRSSPHAKVRDGNYRQRQVRPALPRQRPIPSELASLIQRD
jgi:hypothetical protein